VAGFLMVDHHQFTLWKPDIGAVKLLWLMLDLRPPSAILLSEDAEYLRHGGGEWIGHGRMTARGD